MEARIIDNKHNNPPSEMELLQSRLSEKHILILDGAQKLIEAATRVPSVINDEVTAGKAGDYIKQVTGSIKNLEAQRVNEKEPFLTLGRAVDGFFKKTTDALEVAKKTALKPLDEFQKKKEMEARRLLQEQADLLRKQQEEQERTAKMLQDANMQPQADKMLEQAIVTEQAVAKVEVAAQVKPAELSQSRGSSGSVASLRTRWVGELVDDKTLDLEKLRHHLHPDSLQKAINSYVAMGGRELAGAKIFEKSETVVR